MNNRRLNMLTVQETMDLLEVSRSTLDRWRKHRKLPYIKIGKEVFFDRGVVESWVRQHTISGDLTHTDQANSSIITIGYQSGTAHMWSALVMKQMCLFENELKAMSPHTPKVVHWHNAPNGLQLLKGLVTGSIQIASLGDYPFLLATRMSQILPEFRPGLLAFDGKSHSGRGISLVTPIHSNLMHPDDLTYATIATVPNTSAGFRLGKLISSMKIREVKVVHQEMDRSMVNIIEGRVQASAMWEPYLSLLTAHRHGRVLFDGGLGDDYLTTVVADENWCAHNKDVVISYLRAHLKAHTVIRQDPELAARLIGSFTGIPRQIVLSVLERVRWDASIYQRDLESLASLSAINPECDFNPLADIRCFVQDDYLQHAAETLMLPSISTNLLSGDWSSEILY
ncbi:helix-turn-helix domain-containing protein [Alicyclobacillus mengziensis]|uniref:Helix-turn-helix domain-containing protein n=1 Tax=Alicyclobacillus mengziensis TaxID=2931921 RepID=A0A9X7VYV3_9BACL|nr:helix-turn-helix domain-containing protein [Alicyclobacillus mengziensis]QSO47234.1 helix-turn-helix domain-containing protein [Alicyclobacillus mengziensis]